MSQFIETQVTAEQSATASVLDWITRPDEYVAAFCGRRQRPLDLARREQLWTWLVYFRVLARESVRRRDGLAFDNVKVSVRENPLGFSVTETTTDGTVLQQVELSADGRQATLTTGRRTHRRDVEGDARILARALRR